MNVAWMISFLNYDHHDAANQTGIMEERKHVHHITNDSSPEIIESARLFWIAVEFHFDKPEQLSKIVFA